MWILGTKNTDKYAASVCIATGSVGICVGYLHLHIRDQVRRSLKIAYLHVAHHIRTSFARVWMCAIGTSSTYTHTHTLHTNTHIYTYRGRGTHMSRTHACTITHAFLYEDMSCRIQAYYVAHMHTQHARTHACEHTHMHIYMQIHMYMCKQRMHTHACKQTCIYA